MRLGPFLKANLCYPFRISVCILAASRLLTMSAYVLKLGQLLDLIGPNGAGKTTLFNVIAGLYEPTAGRVILDGQDITGAAPHELFHKGMLRTFQLAHEFSSLTVRENLMMVPPNQSGERLIDTWLSPKKGPRRRSRKPPACQ